MLADTLSISYPRTGEQMLLVFCFSGDSRVRLGAVRIHGDVA